MKPGGKDGKLYAITEKAAIEGDGSTSLTASGFYKIKGIAQTGSKLPQPDSSISGAKGLKAGQVVHLWKGQRLAAGDSLIPLELTLVSFVKDISNSRNGTTYDVSTQENLESGVREFITGAFTEGSGTINGTFETESEGQRILLNQFAELSIDDGTHITRLPAKSSKIDYMMSRRETEIVGETAVWEHFPVTVESITMDKPLDGEQNFNFNYKIDGGNHPGLIYYKVKESA
ncbi:hypothetical protein [Treponema pectinovorum]|uniref:hypothetical protein n=1 Tax=Treponema pectinovorum TaxID=164 RepID=UPI0011CB6108|nr:hypothetical protein [Treponema pectinovorum]